MSTKLRLVAAVSVLATLLLLAGLALSLAGVARSLFRPSSSQEVLSAKSEVVASESAKPIRVEFHPVGVMKD